jgi:hypothetical protein
MWVGRAIHVMCFQGAAAREVTHLRMAALLAQVQEAAHHLGGDPARNPRAFRRAMMRTPKYSQHGSNGQHGNTLQK